MQQNIKNQPHFHSQKNPNTNQNKFNQIYHNKTHNNPNPNANNFINKFQSQGNSHSNSRQGPRRTEEEMNQIKQKYEKLQQKLARYQEQNYEINQDNKHKTKIIAEINQANDKLDLQIQRIHNTVNLSIALLQDTEESKLKAQKIIDQNQICNSKQHENEIKDLRVYTVIYSKLNQNNVKVLLCKKRKREYWFTDNKNVGSKQLYRNGIILKAQQVNLNCIPYIKINTTKENSQEDAIAASKKHIQQLFCFDIEDYIQNEQPKMYNSSKHFTTVYYQVSEENLEKIHNKIQNLFKNVEQVIQNDLTSNCEKENEKEKEKESPYDDSFENNKNSYKKLMAKYGWSLNENGEWNFASKEPENYPQIPLDTSIDSLFFIDYDKDCAFIKSWKKEHSGLDWYYDMIDFLVKQIKGSEFVLERNTSITKSNISQNQDEQNQSQNAPPSQKTIN
ncbi:hypothetical protein PPERSA_08205 [Pseudocohnilembus persalinus]|uniref:Uncharacterized protein n=1 Tax=Pseudocohnilembus persalinus TaxID=266149 RepID=A0A0V0QG96_PSEPJ|nr:hypothetical protein PPERSA_08205 [Pseudocohnilembus persalinus]|eukprot:KRX01104.1 hypothetical protein PPERSA_08205 [Pseudocohnilembus persalinus]